MNSDNLVLGPDTDSHLSGDFWHWRNHLALGL